MADMPDEPDWDEIEAMEAEAMEANAYYDEISRDMHGSGGMPQEQEEPDEATLAAMDSSARQDLINFSPNKQPQLHQQQQHHL